MQQKYIDNLIKAREGLMGLDPELLDMETFRKDENGKADVFVNEDSCGTFGCALGWCPFIDGLEPAVKDYNNTKRLDFDTYSKRVFNLSPGETKWIYLFDSAWKDKDNTVSGLIKRLTRVIEGKKITKKDLPEGVI